MIPKWIHHIWFDFGKTPKCNRIPSAYEKTINECKDLNPTWKCTIWYDTDAYQFVTQYFPEFLSIFVRVLPIQRVDIFRYMLMYEYGGIYLDTDVECHKSFDSLIDMIEHSSRKGPGNLAILSKSRDFYGINNGTLMSTKKHPLWILLLKQIKQDLDQPTWWQKVWKWHGWPVISTTGPIALSRAYRQMKKRKNNTNKIILLPSYYLQGKFFCGRPYGNGIYSTHKFHVTWCSKSYPTKIIVWTIIVLFILFVIRAICNRT